MVTSSNLVFSVAAVRRLLGLAASVAVQIREFAWVVWVWVRGKRPTFISKKAFYQHFVDRRKAEAKNLTVQKEQFQNLHTVSNPSKGSSYQVATLPNEIDCTCDDYKNQIDFWGKGCCKHGYAVLGVLGFTSLANYKQAITRFAL